MPAAVLERDIIDTSAAATPMRAAFSSSTSQLALVVSPAVLTAMPVRLVNFGRTFVSNTVLK
jgi:hypothetical protein